MSSLSLSAGQDPVRDAERGSVTRIGLEEFADGRPPFILNRSELKLLGITPSFVDCFQTVADSF
jgi:hypothetical protein